MAEPEIEPGGLPPDERTAPARAASVAVCIAVGVVALNTTAISVATGGIADELGLSLDTLGWVMGAYLVTAAAFALIGGRLGDVIGRGRTFAIGLTVLASGLVVAAVAPSSTTLIVGRAIQGVGAALIMPASIEVIVGYSAPSVGPSTGFRARGIVYASAFGIGPLLGGVLTDYLSWRWVFWTELVITLLAGAFTFTLRRSASHVPHRPTRDFRGALLVAALVLVIMVGAHEVRSWGRWWVFVAWALLVVLLGAALLTVESRVAHPLIHPSLLRDRTVVGANLATLGASIGMLGLLYFFGVFAQNAAGLDSTALGVAISLSAFTISIVAFSVLAGFLSHRLGYRGPVVVGLSLSIAGFWWLSRVTVGTTEAQLVLPLALCGVGAGIANAGLTAPAVLTKSLARMNEAAGLTSLVRFLGSATAIALGTASFLSVSIGSHVNQFAIEGHDPEALATGGGEFRRAVASLRQDLRAPFEAASRQSTVDAFAHTMRLTAFLLLGLTVISTFLLARAGSHSHPGHTAPRDPPDDEPGSP